MMAFVDTSGSVHERIDGHTFAEERLLLDDCVNEQLRQHFPATDVGAVALSSSRARIVSRLTRTCNVYTL